MEKVLKKERRLVIALLSFALILTGIMPFRVFADDTVSNVQTENQGTENQGTENQGTENQEPENQGNENQEPENQGTENQETPIVDTVSPKPAVPVLKSAKLDSNGIIVSWKEANYAAHYNLYRKSNINKKWKKVYSGKKLTWKDKNVETGVLYTYTVRAENTSGLSSYDKQGVSMTYVGQPKMTSVKNGTSGITVTWKNVKNANGYYVYRRTKDGWKKIKKIKSGSTVSYTDETVEAGTLYNYNVRAYFGKTLSHYNPDGLYIYRLNALKNISVARKSDTCIAVEWKRATKASGYQIKFANDSETKTITLTGNSITSYELKKLKKNTSYKIYIRSYRKTSSGKTYYSVWSPKNVMSTALPNRKTLVIGDSRTYQMSIWGGANAGKFYWLGEGGVSTAFINPVTQGTHTNFYVNLGRVMPNAVCNSLGCGYSFELASQIRAHGITTIIYALGTNNLGSDYGLSLAITQAVNTLKLLKKETGCEVIFASTLPCNDGRGFSYGYTVTDARVRAYNSSVRAQTEPYGIIYLDTYSVVSPADATDGIHYSVSANTAVVDYYYQKLYAK